MHIRLISKWRHLSCTLDQGLLTSFQFVDPFKWIPWLVPDSNIRFIVCICTIVFIKAFYSRPLHQENTFGSSRHCYWQTNLVTRANFYTDLRTAGAQWDHTKVPSSRNTPLDVTKCRSSVRACDVTEIWCSLFFFFFSSLFLTLSSLRKLWGRTVRFRLFSWTSSVTVTGLFYTFSHSPSPGISSVTRNGFS